MKKAKCGVPERYEIDFDGISLDWGFDGDRVLSFKELALISAMKEASDDDILRALQVAQKLGSVTHKAQRLFSNSWGYLWNHLKELGDRIAYSLHDHFGPASMWNDQGMMGITFSIREDPISQEECGVVSCARLNEPRQFAVLLYQRKVGILPFMDGVLPNLAKLSDSDFYENQYWTLTDPHVWLVNSVINVKGGHPSYHRYIETIASFVVERVILFLQQEDQKQKDEQKKKVELVN